MPTKEEKKRIHLQIVRLIALALACLTVATCGPLPGKVEITSRDPSRTNLTTPFDLVVEHKGCGEPRPGIEAWLDKGTRIEQAIGSAFVFDGGHKWTALAYPLPEGRQMHMLLPGKSYAAINDARSCADDNDNCRDLCTFEGVVCDRGCYVITYPEE